MQLNQSKPLDPNVIGYNIAIHKTMIETRTYKTNAMELSIFSISILLHLIASEHCDLVLAVEVGQGFEGGNCYFFIVNYDRERFGWGEVGFHGLERVSSVCVMA